MSEPTIPAKEIADLFRKVIAGKAKIVPDGPSWEWVWAGNFSCVIEGYAITIFNDCGELDYVDSATSPDGRTCDFDTWWDNGVGPVDELDSEEDAQFVAALESCGSAPTASQ